MGTAGAAPRGRGRGGGRAAAGAGGGGGRELVLSGAEPSSAGPPRPVAALLKEHRAAIRAAAAAVGARNVRVFGSVARGEETAESDVDLLVDFPAEERGLFPLLKLA